MPIPVDPKQYAAPKPQGTKGGKKTTPVTGPLDQFVDPLASVPTPASLGLTDTSSFVTQLAKIAAQAGNVKAPNYGDYHPQASNWAGQDIAAQVNPLLTQQQQLLKTGRQQAGLINQAGQAAATFTEPWAQGIRDTYLGLGDRQLQLAQGLSGDTRNAALSDAQAYNDQMARMGSPQGIDATRANALSSALAGLGGLSANTLWQQAAAAYTGALGVPQQMLGYGQAQAAGTLGAATQEAAKINPQIANIRATRGKLTREYQQDLFKNAQTTQDLKLKYLGMRADLVNSGFTMANASNEQKLKFAEFKQTAVESHNAIVSANRTFKQREREINQQWNIAKMEDANADATRAQELKIANANRDAQVTQANQALEVQWANARGWYTDPISGKPVALPGNHLVVGKNGKVSARPDLTPTDKYNLQQAKNATASLANETATTRGWYWLGTGKDRHRVAREGNVLVFGKGGKFEGVKRDPTQYASGAAGAGGLKPKDAVKLTTSLQNDLKDWAYGTPPPEEKGALPGQFVIPGYDKESHQITNLNLYQSAKGTLPLTYSEILTNVMQRYSSILRSPEQAQALVDSYYTSQGLNPAYAKSYNLATNDPRMLNWGSKQWPPTVTAGVASYGGQ
jgi:hypothetical protein